MFYIVKGTIGSLAWGGGLATTAYVFTIASGPKMLAEFSVRTVLVLSLWGGAVLLAASFAKAVAS